MSRGGPTVCNNGKAIGPLPMVGTAVSSPKGYAGHLSARGDGSGVGYLHRPLEYLQKLVGNIEWRPCPVTRPHDARFYQPIEAGSPSVTRLSVNAAATLYIVSAVVTTYILDKIVYTYYSA